MSYKINDTFVGMVRDYYDEKKTMLKEEYFVNAGKKEGIYKLYDNGVLEKEINYINGLRHGICKIYHFNGKLFEESNYINDKKTGICKIYDSGGFLDSEVNYIDGLKQGICKSYHYNGKIYEEAYYIDDEKKFYKLYHDFE